MSVRVSRPKGMHWKRKAYAHLVERDGASCSKCSEPEKVLFRSNGVWSGERWGPDPWETHRYTAINRTSNLEVDHRVPLSEGGDNDYANLWLLCVECHKAKTIAERSARLKRMFAEARA